MLFKFTAQPSLSGNYWCRRALSSSCDFHYENASAGIWKLLTQFNRTLLSIQPLKVHGKEKKQYSLKITWKRPWAMLKGLEGSQLAITNSRKFIAPAGYYFWASLHTSDSQRHFHGPLRLPYENRHWKVFCTPRWKEAFRYNSFIKVACFLIGFTVGVRVYILPNGYYLLNAVGYFETTISYN